MNEELQALVDGVVGSAPEVSWSVCLRDAGGAVLAAATPAEQLPTASIGKLVLLLELARRLEIDPELGERLVDRRAVAPVAEAGLWQHLRVDELPVLDVAVLVASFSDNLATNVLVDLVGLPDVTRLGRDLGLERTQLLDIVRPARDPAEHPPHLSLGCADELSGLMVGMGARTLVSAAVSERLEAWLATGADLSMVASGLGLDPLAHVEPDLGLLLRNKTGTDAGTKGDVGLLRGPRATVGYAVLARWDADRADLRTAVDLDMRRIGEGLLAHVR